MKINKLKIILEILFVVAMLVACHKVNAKEIPSELTTYMLVNDVEIRVGMASEEIESGFPEDDIETIYAGAKLIECKDININKVLNNNVEDNIVLKQNAYVDYLFDSDDKLREVYVVYDTIYEHDVIYSELALQYGEKYKVTYTVFGSNIHKTYRWDMEDGVSVLWLHEIEDKYGTCVIMIHTADIDEEKQFDSLEEAEKFLKD